jgi:hypothetical protein
MTYIAVRWHHANSEEPTELYSELDSDRFEMRKVEVLADGHAQYADSVSETGSTALGLVPVPPLEEIASDPQFTPRIISAAEFEIVWLAAHKTT